MTVLGYLDGRPLPRHRLDEALSTLRTGPRAAALPAPGTAEERQLARWLAQVILISELCQAEAAAWGLALDSVPGERLDQQAAVELGSFVAAAYRGSPAVRAVYAAVTADVTVSDEEAFAYWTTVARPLPTRWVLRHALNDGPPQPLGPATHNDLPKALAAALTTAAPGDTVTATDQLGRHRATVLQMLPARQPCYAQDAPAIRDTLLAAARRRAFTGWLDHARAHRIRLVPGLEHPGDPRQPDNHHSHH